MVNLFHKLFFIPVEPNVLIRRTLGQRGEGGAGEAGRDGEGEVGGVGGRGRGEERGGGGRGEGGGGRGGGGARRLCILLLTVILVFISVGGMCELTRVMWAVLQ